jgi:manganese-dependent inorganic pyrophosphatase
LAEELSVNLSEYSAQMFAAKSDVSAFSDVELLRMDSKSFPVGDQTLRVSVLETTAPHVVLARKAALMAAMGPVALEDNVDQVLLFVVDILAEEATLLVPNEAVKSIAEKSFDVCVDGDSVVLPGVMSRKKQIVPQLTL